MFDTAVVTATIRPTQSLADRRVWERHVTVLRADCGRITDGMDPRLPAKVRNLSAGGLGLILQRPFQPGTVLVVRFKAEDGGAPGVLFARVVHIRAYSRTEWLAGCAFASPLVEEELEGLLVQNVVVS